MEVLRWAHFFSYALLPILASSRKRRTANCFYQTHQKRSRVEQPKLDALAIHEGASSSKSLSSNCPLSSNNDLLRFDSNWNLMNAERNRWEPFRKCLSSITLDGRDVAATLDGGCFYRNLPYIDAVLPSMLAGEQYFVPLFVQQILLPYWRGQRRDLCEFERGIIRLSQPSFAAAMSSYMERLFMAAILQLEAPSDEKAARENATIEQLVMLIVEFFGKSLFTDLNLDDLFKPEVLKEKVSQNIENIPSLLMIGRQWGLDEKRAASSILEMGFLDYGALNLDWSQRTAMIVTAINEGNGTFTNLDELTVESVAWTLKPEFSFGSHDRVEALQRYALRKSSRPLPAPYRNANLKKLLQVLEAREFLRNPEFTTMAPLELFPSLNAASSASTSTKWTQRRIRRTLIDDANHDCDVHWLQDLEPISTSAEESSYFFNREPQKSHPSSIHNQGFGCNEAEEDSRCEMFWEVDTISSSEGLRENKESQTFQPPTPYYDESERQPGNGKEEEQGYQFDQSPWDNTVGFDDVLHSYTDSLSSEQKIALFASNFDP